MESFWNRPSAQGVIDLSGEVTVYTATVGTFPLMGVVAGALGDEAASRPEQDFHGCCESEQGWKSLARLFDEIAAAKSGL